MADWIKCQISPLVKYRQNQISIALTDAQAWYNDNVCPSINVQITHRSFFIGPILFSIILNLL